MMRRTQLYLDEATYQFLRSLARSKEKSMAEVVREIIDSFRTNYQEKDSLFEVIGIADIKEKHIASRYEEVLYGGKG